MQKIIFPFLSLCLLASLNSIGQELYQPRNIREAYQKGTRSLDGKPGKNYWQNQGNYDMNITVTPVTKLVEGTASIVYSNHSPDTLKSIVIRFVNNIHKPQSPRAGIVSPDFLTSGLNITSLLINNETYNVNSSTWGTVGTIQLKRPLNPGEKANFSISWNYPLSKESGREGQLDSTTFFVAYAYPRISVYDDYNGWDKLPHTDGGEFYNDFNNYRLNVKAPKNYVVWATGDLQNPDEVLQPEFAARLQKSMTSDQVIAIANAAEMAAGKVTRQNEWNTWKFTANHITDVTFALSNHYLWDGGSVIVDPKTKRRASVQSAYDSKAPDFPHAVAWGKLALEWFSTKIPGIPYPFSKSIAVQGFADMEYPMMVNDSSTPDMEFSQFVLNHEIAHTYFPFYMGTNETRYAHMDEGWATTLEYLIGIDQLGFEKATENYKRFRVKGWITNKATEEDQPIISLSTQVSGAGYSHNAYGKPSLAYLGLKDLLGDEAFKKALHVYMERWNGKHPIPWDFFYAINNASGQNLNWYWNNWFFSNNYIDLTIANVAANNLDYTISLNNTGGFAVPFDVSLTYNDGSKEVLHQTPAIWKDNQKTASIQVKAKKTVSTISIDGGIFMDASPSDNLWKNK